MAFLRYKICKYLHLLKFNEFFMVKSAKLLIKIKLNKDKGVRVENNTKNG